MTNVSGAVPRVVETVTSTEWILALAAVTTLFPEEMKNKHSQKGKSRLRLLMAAATFQRYQWYLNNARLRSTVAYAVMRRCTQSSVVFSFRQAYNVPTFRLKLDLFKLSK